jgi:hypothetical protein
MNATTTKVFVTLGAASALIFGLCGCGTAATSGAPTAVGTTAVAATPTADPVAAAPVGDIATTPADQAKPPVRAAAPSVQPFNVGGYLGGNAKPTFPVGEPGQVSIVAQGPLDKYEGEGASLPIAFRNNTGAAISGVSFSANARLNGKLVAGGQDQGAIPAQVQPGEVGFAYIYFAHAKSMVVTGLKYEFTAKSSPADNSSYFAPLTVGEVTNDGSSIVGTAVNKTGKAVHGPYSVQVYCFAGNKLTEDTQALTDQDTDLAAGAEVSFTVELRVYDIKCDKFTVGVSGYYE